MNIKLIALDLDGTTLNEKGIISQRTKNALEAAADKGIKIVVATGRPFVALPKDIFKIDAIRYVLTSNGAVITDLKGNNVIYQNCMSSKTALAAIDMLKDSLYIIEAFTGGKAYMQADYYNHIKKTRESFRSIDYILNTRLPIDDIWSLIRENKDKMENINVNYHDMGHREILKAKLETLPEATITSSFAHALEIGGKTTSKADALIKMCESFDISAAEMMAAGDSFNDLEMLRIAGFAVAMGNGAEEIKSIADFVAPTNKEDGLALALENFILK